MLMILYLIIKAFSCIYIMKALFYKFINDEENVGIVISINII